MSAAHLTSLNLQSVPCGIFLLDQDLLLLDANQTLYELLGLPPEAVLGRALDDFLVPAFRLLFHMQAMTMLHANGRVEEIFLNLTGEHQRAIPVLFNAVRLRESSATVFQCVVMRVNERKRLEDDLFNIKKAVELVPGVVFQYQRRADGSDCVPYASEGIRTTYGLRPVQVMHSAQLLHERTHPEDLPAFLSSLDASAQTLSLWHLEYRIKLPDNSIRWLDARALPEARSNGDVLWHGYIHDITERRKRHQAVEHRATHDHLTGLPNRAEFERVLSQLFESAQTSGAVHALCCVDLDRFKQVNDTAGHAAGDQLLQRLAGVLQSCVRTKDTVARLGGDEFALLLENCDQEAAQRVAELVCSKVSALHFESHGTVFQIGASIGVASINRHRARAQEVQAAADRACYAAKAAGRGCVKVAPEG